MITDAALGAACPGGDGDCDAGNNEVCSTDGTDVCICNSASSYAAGPVDTATCYLGMHFRCT